MIFEDIHRGEVEVDVRISSYTTTPALICDIDGTIADNSHRTSWLMTKPKNWKAYNKGMSKDTPIDKWIDKAIALYSMGWNVVFCSGREEIYREVTETWLLDNTGFRNSPLYMRPKKDYRKDSLVKKELYEKIVADGYNPQLVFDDRNQVVDMWRQIPIRCIQVAEGDF